MVVLLMGVSGVGKTMIGRMLAEQLGWIFADADDYHSVESVAKMQAGLALTDKDRGPWLVTLGRTIESWLADETNAVLACSALKAVYRVYLHAEDPRVRVVHLVGDRALIRKRIEARSGHYMPPSLLDSQYHALEVPPDAISVDVSGTPEETLAAVRRALDL